MEVYRIGETLSRTPRFLSRVFTEGERAYCDAKGAAANQSYAARFAAKEAVFKALKTGWRGNLSWQEVEVTVTELGAPEVRLRGKAAELFAASGANRIHISLSHTAEHAVAQVILERE
ncbi:MAG: holo-acyl-carrier-protein synthase [Acidobacteria bacterium OLB17]|nr:MAG: holo-acyl-carrier-protein synthase [Acidobacteria bacterium OLB17]